MAFDRSRGSRSKATARRVYTDFEVDGATVAFEWQEGTTFFPRSAHGGGANVRATKCLFTGVFFRIPPQMTFVADELLSPYKRNPWLVEGRNVQ